jgi:IS30 family transposase
VLKRDKSTISREVRRNRGLRGYRPKQAQHLALARREAKAKPRIAPGTWEWIESLLREEWSPEQVSGCCRWSRDCMSVTNGSTSMSAS